MLRFMDIIHFIFHFSISKIIIFPLKSSQRPTKKLLYMISLPKFKILWPNQLNLDLVRLRVLYSARYIRNIVALCIIIFKYTL